MLDCNLCLFLCHSQFRHRVKFEGMEPPPSRSSQCSQFSSISSRVSPPGLRMESSTSSRVSVSSTLTEGHEVQQYLERLLPSVDSLLAGFDRVNQLTSEVCNIEEQLQKVQSRIVKNRKKQSEPQPQMPSTPKLSRPSQTSDASTLQMGLKPSLSTHDGIPKVPAGRRATHSESSLLGPSAPLMAHLSRPGRHTSQTVDPKISGFPKRRAWHSGSCHSADTAQRFTKSQSSGHVPARPRSEEGDWTEASDGMPIKKTAWHSDPSEIEKD